MSNNGYIVSKKGKGQVFKDGSLAVFNANGYCQDCCCKPKILASYTTNSSHPTWDLTPWQGDGQAPPGSFWRLRERGAGLLYGSGTVDENGKLVGLPNSFTSNYSYDGYMQLEIGCRQPDGSIKWP
jgi:hypothetical protein